MAAGTAGCELYKKYRPTKPSEVVGQNDALNALFSLLKSGRVPHVLLFTGPSGCGKTTLARMMAAYLKCDVNSMDYTEINASSSRGIDTIREVESQVNFMPMSGGVRVWYFDEVQAWTAAAQDAALKLLEDPPEHVYIILATTDPKKLKDTIITRCTRIDCKPISVSTLEEHVKKIAGLEGIVLGDHVAARIASFSNNSARQALVHLHAISKLDPGEQADQIFNPEVETTSFQIAQIIYRAKSEWREIAELLNGFKEEGDVEMARRVILGYGKSILLKQASPRAATVMEIFRSPYFDTGTAYNLFVLDCYRAWDA